MPRSKLALAIALAACSFALPALGDADTVALQLTPVGNFMPSDDRPMLVPHWHIDAAVAAKVIERFNAKRNPRVIDYEHQTLNKETNGQPAPAAGWITGLEWREGEGLFAVAKLTQRAKQLIESGEYGFVSPVFIYDAKTGDVLDIRMAALTNDAAIDGMQPLELRAAATFGIHQEEDPMNKLLLAVIAGLALSSDTDEDAAVAALTAHFKADPLADVRKALGVEGDAKPEAVVAACTAMATKAAAAADADPSKFVPLAQFETVKTELAALTAKQRDGEVAALVEQGLANGRLLPAQKDWATSLGKKDVAALTAYLESAQPIAALTRSQTEGVPPEKTDANPHALTVGELAVCSMTGITAEDFAKSKAQTKTAQAV